MTKVAITGGIGTGKSYVCALLRKHGIQVYDCDAGAKRLMRSSMTIRRQLCQLVGEEVYQNGILQKQVLASFLLQSHEHALAIDEIVHPAVARDFESSGMDWIESAIFFDSGFWQRVSVDKVVCVTAPLEVRLHRIMERDHITREKAMAWVQRQWPQEDVVAHSDFEIVNDGQCDLEEQIDLLLKTIYKK